MKSGLSKSSKKSWKKPDKNGLTHTDLMTVYRKKANRHKCFTFPLTKIKLGHDNYIIEKAIYNFFLQIHYVLVINIDFYAPIA